MKINGILAPLPPPPFTRTIVAWKYICHIRATKKIQIFHTDIYMYDVLCILCILGKIKAKNFNRYLYRFLSIDFVSTSLQIVVSSRCTRG